MFRYLIRACPASVDMKDDMHFTPLHYAVHFDNNEFAGTLLAEGGAKTDQKGHRLKSPFHFAKSPIMIKLLMEYTTDPADPYKKKLNKDEVARKENGHCFCNLKYVLRSPPETSESRKKIVAAAKYIGCKCNCLKGQPKSSRTIS